jgi:hypothetical protein
VGSELNTPASGFWNISCTVAPTDLYSPGQNLVISFTPTGEIDSIGSGYPFDMGLGPEIPEPLLQQADGVVDFLKSVNWLFVSGYWLILYDLGQVSPIVYGLNNKMTQFGEFGALNLSEFRSANSSYNIFTNQTLFQNYSQYMLENLVDIAYGSSPIQFLPLSETNRIQPNSTTIYRNFLCSERRIKGWFSLLISVFAADYAVLGGGYTIFKFVMGWIQKRKDNGKSLNVYPDRI